MVVCAREAVRKKLSLWDAASLPEVVAGERTLEGVESCLEELLLN